MLSYILWRVCDVTTEADLQVSWITGDRHTPGFGHVPSEKDYIAEVYIKLTGIL